MGYFTDLGRRFLAEEDHPEASKASHASEPPVETPIVVEPSPVKTPTDPQVVELTTEENTQTPNATGASPVIMSGSGSATHTQPPGRQISSGKEHDALQQRLADLASGEENPIEKSHGRGAATAEDHFCSSPARGWHQDHTTQGTQNGSRHKTRRVIPSRDSTLFSVEAGSP